MKVTTIPPDWGHLADHIQAEMTAQEAEQLVHALTMAMAEIVNNQHIVEWIDTLSEAIKKARA